MYIYRVATISDYEEIIKMKNKVKQKVIDENLPIWQDGYPQDELIKEDIDNLFGRVVEVDGKIVSYATYHHASYEYDKGTFPCDEVMSFGRVMTDVNETKKGYASILIENMILETKKMDIPGMGILVDNFNKKALSIYLKHGFKYIKTEKFPWAILDVYYLDFENEQ